MANPILVTFESLQHDVEVLKLKKADIQAKYGLPTVAATSRLLKEAGLKIRPVRYPVFQLVRSTNLSDTETVSNGAHQAHEANILDVNFEFEEVESSEATNETQESTNY